MTPLNVLLAWAFTVCCGIRNLSQCEAKFSRKGHCKQGTVVKRCQNHNHSFLFHRLKLFTACRDSFQIRRNYHALGASRGPATINSVADCDTYCRSLTFVLCAAFSFHRTRRECWIHADTRNLLDNNQVPNNQMDLYIRVQDGSCGGE